MPRGSSPGGWCTTASASRWPSFAAARRLTINAAHYVPAANAKDSWKIDYGFGSEGVHTLGHEAVVRSADGAAGGTGSTGGAGSRAGVEFDIPLKQPNDPALDAVLRVKLRPWNRG